MLDTLRLLRDDACIVVQANKMNSRDYVGLAAISAIVADAVNFELVKDDRLGIKVAHLHIKVAHAHSLPTCSFATCVFLT